MKILGVDPGLTNCGIGIIQSTGRRNIIFENAYIISTLNTDKFDNRLKQIGEKVTAIIKKHKPDILVCEKIFAQENRASVISVAQVSGMIIYIGVNMNIKIAMHTPTEVKSAITGNGRADKKQIQYMVKKILKLTETPNPPDLADSLAVAICHAWNPSSISLDNVVSKTPAQQNWIEAIKTTKKSGYYNR